MGICFLILLIFSILMPSLYYHGPGYGYSKQKVTKKQLRALKKGLDAFHFDIGYYPTTQEGLQALMVNPGIDKWDGPYHGSNQIPLDPWERPFHYLSPGTHGEYDLYSYGKDGTPGGDGDNADITSWE